MVARVEVELVNYVGSNPLSSLVKVDAGDGPEYMALGREGDGEERGEKEEGKKVNTPIAWRSIQSSLTYLVVKQ